MTHDEAKAALAEIYQITGYGASLTLETPDLYIPTKSRKIRYYRYWRVTYIIDNNEYHEDASTPEQAITAALNHVRTAVPDK